jgi:ABC-type amino acid transport substrate-binding protein
MADLPTIRGGVLAVASAYPDPPFEVQEGTVATGFDADLMQTVCSALDLEWELVKYRGDDFNGIFDGLGTSHDAVASGATITPQREQVALFSEPYLESGQSLVVNKARTPEIASVDDLTGQIVGIQAGNTSDAVARGLEARGAIKGIQYYPYRGILDALGDLEAGKIGGFMKLLPVTTWLVRDRPDLAVVQEIPTHEQLGVAVSLGNKALRDAIDGALSGLKTDGTLGRLTKKWLA